MLFLNFGMSDSSATAYRYLMNESFLCWYIPSSLLMKEKMVSLFSMRVQWDMSIGSLLKATLVSMWLNCNCKKITGNKDIIGAFYLIASVYVMFFC